MTSCIKRFARQAASDKQSRPPARRSRRGLTLVELLIALMITSLISLGVAALIHAAAYGTSSRREVRRLVVRSHSIRTRFGDAVRQARAVLACGQTGDGEEYLVLWMGDTATSDANQVNLSELRLLEWDPATQELTSYQTASIPDPDPSYAADADFYDEADQARDDGDLVGTLWSENVTGFDVVLDQAPPLLARKATCEATLTDALLSEVLVTTAALRSPGEPE